MNAAWEQDRVGIEGACANGAQPKKGAVFKPTWGEEKKKIANQNRENKRALEWLLEKMTTGLGSKNILPPAELYVLIRESASE